jgi:hypothetical protein
MKNKIVAIFISITGIVGVTLLLILTILFCYFVSQSSNSSYTTDSYFLTLFYIRLEYISLLYRVFSKINISYR